MWAPPGSKAQIGRWSDFESPDVRVIAVANPELAPYGKAAIAFLKSGTDWERIEPKIVYAENISMAKQYGKSGNADVVLTAYSLVLHEAGKVMKIPGGGLEQEAAIIAASRRQREARKFIDFLARGKGRETLVKYGYEIGPSVNSR